MTDMRKKKLALKDLLLLVGVILANVVILGILVQSFWFGD